MKHPAKTIFAIMRQSFITLVLLLLWFPARAETPADAESILKPVPGRWTKERANAWYEGLPWLVGCNYYPATAINQIEMWQASTWDPKTIDKELGWAAGIGMNTLRVYLHDLVWADDKEGLYRRMDEFLDICQRHGIRPFFVFFDDCHYPEPKLGEQPLPVRGWHNSGWNNCPARDVALRFAQDKATPEEVARLKGYIQDTMRRFKDDQRVLFWELYNEPGQGKNLGEDMADTSSKLVHQSWVWARAMNPSQPIASTTAGSVGQRNIAINRANSDIHSIHHYGPPASLEKLIRNYQRDGRPVIMTEWLARTRGSTVADCLPVLKKHKVGAVNWGFVSGKSGTIWPWESRNGKDVNEERRRGNVVKPGEAFPEPKLWFHDLFRTDGTPFDRKEIEMFRQLTGKTVAGGSGRITLTGTQMTRLSKALEPHHANYDPAARMLREPLQSPGYHTTLKDGYIHSTRSSLGYAVALLDTGDESLLRRAEDILRAVIALQDQNPESKTCGVWPWFLEEPLAKMSPPDRNWADFCGVQLLQVVLDHRERLSPEVAALVDTAISHAVRAIQRRNVGPDYTNIAIMGTYATLVAAEFYGWDDLREYALARLRRFHAYTMEQGAFTEYNSPTYSVVAVAELGRMTLHVKDAEARRLVEELYRMAWEEIAHHFHPPTRQWAGPHSRSYSTLLQPRLIAFIQRATEGRVDFGVDQPGIAEHRLPLPCPLNLEPCFRTLDAPRHWRKTYLKSEPPVIGTTCLDPGFALGTINRGDLWNQRRALVAYWGTAAKPSYLHLRFLRDGYDFAAAQFFSAQRGGDAVAAINFATDGGNTHVSMDRLKNGVFTAKELRLRFEFGGEAGGREFPSPAKLSDLARVQSGEVQIQLAVPHAVFGDAKPRWASGRNQGTSWLDVVLHEGAEREFRLAEIQQAALALAVRITKGESPSPNVTITRRNGQLAVEWEDLHVNVPVRPDKVEALQRAVRFSAKP